jgi:hypothetical protein
MDGGAAKRGERGTRYLSSPKETGDKPQSVIAATLAQTMVRAIYPVSARTVDSSGRVRETVSLV